MHIAILTAGGAGMFCGSCMHDNTWAKALQEAGVEVSLIPAYTPIRTDEEDLSSGRVFFGGINTYLNHQSQWWSKLPRWTTRWLDHPTIIRWATRYGVSNNAQELGEMTLAMLAGEDGPQGTAGEELAKYLEVLKPDVLFFTNALLAGVLPQIRKHYQGRVYCTLQGDDIFLEGLPAHLKPQAISRITELAPLFDGFVCHSEYYRQFMAGYLSIPTERIHLLPLTIDGRKHAGQTGASTSGTSPKKLTRIGYFARICPEKGLHQLVDAAVSLHEQREEFEVVAAGYLPPHQQTYLKQVQTAAKPLGSRFQYLGSPDTHAEKVAILSTFDVMCVPTEYRDPKGIFLLEAMANGVPVVAPAHGAFPEIIASTGGGVLYPPGDQAALAATLHNLIHDAAQRQALAETGRANVGRHHDLGSLAKATVELLSRP